MLCAVLTSDQRCVGAKECIRSHSRQASPRLVAVESDGSVPQVVLYDDWQPLLRPLEARDDERTAGIRIEHDGVLHRLPLPAAASVQIAACPILPRFAIAADEHILLCDVSRDCIVHLASFVRDRALRARLDAMTDRGCLPLGALQQSMLGCPKLLALASPVIAYGTAAHGATPRPIVTRETCY